MNADSTNQLLSGLRDTKNKTMAINRDVFKSAKPATESAGVISVWDKLQMHD